MDFYSTNSYRLRNEASAKQGWLSKCILLYCIDQRQVILWLTKIWLVVICYLFFRSGSSSIIHFCDTVCMYVSINCQSLYKLYIADVAGFSKLNSVHSSLHSPLVPHNPTHLTILLYMGVSKNLSIYLYIIYLSIYLYIIYLSIYISFIYLSSIYLSFYISSIYLSI